MLCVDKGFIGHKIKNINLHNPCFFIHAVNLTESNCVQDHL